MSSTTTNPLSGEKYSRNYFTQLQLAQKLPVAEQMPDILAVLKKYNILVLVGETGSGKTTQVPPGLLLEKEFLASNKKIVVTQNRRLAADMVSDIW